jgi:uncharacterized protein (DUF4213/DUF364 family)
MFASIWKYVQLAMVGVAVVEQVSTTDTGATKQQKAIDLITNEAQVVGIAVPGIAPVLPSIVNMVVEGFNIAGLFSHKPAGTQVVVK